MNEILDLLPIPSPRDLPPGQLEARRVALVAATRADAARPPVGPRVLRAAREYVAKTRLWLLGIVALVAALSVTGFSVQQRSVQRGAVTFLAAAGTVQFVAALAPGASATRSS